jgi:anti-anti-sigma factor
MLFDVMEEERRGWSVVRVIGDVDLATMPTLHAALERRDPARVALDLAGATMLDPLALGVVIGAALRSSRRGGEFVVCCPEGAARNLFIETGLDRVMRLVLDVDQLA